ncbi:MAG: adventurous gliding motility protein CglE [Deltaproteobacteria bacterium]|nr:adventurous gliding motility protein CglE [Deltaproteobacteria bacterium]
MCRLLASFALLALGSSAPVFAQAPDDSSSDSPRRAARDFSSMQVKEINRGFYAKTNVGGWVYLGDFSGLVKPGTSIALAFGQDFVDRERSSMAWEVALFQGIHNGMHYQAQMDTYGTAYVEGDLRTYSAAALLEYSSYPTRRFGIGARFGGGMLYSPLLIDEKAWLEDVVPKYFQNGDPGYHAVAHPLVMAGPTIEYYTKMSHFSVGLDLDVIYAMDFDLGTSFTGTLKYSF